MTRQEAITIEQEPSREERIIRCRNCRHNNNCEIQYAAQAGSKFFCGSAERREEMDALEQEPSKATGEWIPVSERLPDKNGNYIISLEDTVDPSARFFNGKWFMSSIDAIAREYGKYEVVAWMPLPEPYKESD